MSRQRTLRLRQELDSVFSTTRMTSAWKNSVRPGLRNQTPPDLHDYLDYQRNLAAILGRIRAEVLDGRYRPASPVFMLQEKKYGVPRRLAIPSAEDALVLQTLSDFMRPALLGASPDSEHAHYSRSHMPPTFEQLDDSFAYPWWISWPRFQKQIWKFTQEHDYLVTTDIANYFDCIPLSSLRSTLSALGDFRQDPLNLTFYVLEAMSWRPYYMPASGVGLPQINFDAPRLLAHSYLYPVDRDLSAATNGSFARWMDDINAGVSSLADGKRILRDLELLLNSLGLRLNASKTQILSAEEATKHFWIRENARLNVISGIVNFGTGSAASRKRTERWLRLKYRAFLREEQIGNAEKLRKRYIGLFTRIQSGSLEREMPSLLASRPGLREHAFKYLRTLGFSISRYRIVRSFLLSGDASDDASVYRAASCLADWCLPKSGTTLAEVGGLGLMLLERGDGPTLVRLAAALLLVSKYGTHEQMKDLLRVSERVWLGESWAARQVVACLPLLEQEMQKEVLGAIVRVGHRDALGVGMSLDEIGRLEQPDRQLANYLLYPPSSGYAYPLGKVIVARRLYHGSLSTAWRRKMKSELTPLLRDANLVRLVFSRSGLRN